MTFIFIFVFTFNFKEFFYQHEKYGIDDNFNKAEISFVKPLKISYELIFKNIKIDKDSNTIETYFSSIAQYQNTSTTLSDPKANSLNDPKANKLSDQKDYLIFKNIKQIHKINKKEYINKSIVKKSKKSSNLKKEVLYTNGIFQLKETLLNIDKSIFDLLFLNITFPKEVDVGYMWSVEKDKSINIDNYNYHYKEKYYIKFLGYKGSKLIFKINYFLYNDSLIEKNIINSYGEIILTINNNNIESIDGKIKMLDNKILNKISFSSKVIK